MKVNFDAEIKNLNDETIFLPRGKDKDVEVPLTLAGVAIGALCNLTEKDRAMTGEKKFELYVLAVIIKQGGEIDLKAKDIMLLKDRIGQINTPLIVGRAYELLEPEEANSGKTNKKD